MFSSFKNVATRGKAAAKVLTVLAVSALVFIPAYSASASTASLTGSQQEYDVVYYKNARTDTYPNNLDSFKWTGGKYPQSLSLAMRPALSDSGTYARGTAYSLNTSTALKNDAGRTGNPAGTFYMSASILVGCGSSSGCGTNTWTATLSYNIRGPAA